MFRRKLLFFLHLKHAMVRPKFIWKGYWWRSQRNSNTWSFLDCEFSQLFPRKYALLLANHIATLQSRGLTMCRSDLLLPRSSVVEATNAVMLRRTLKHSHTHTHTHTHHPTPPQTPKCRFAYPISERRPTRATSSQTRKTCLSKEFPWHDFA